ncbi:hypothetical protein L1987_24166 [Smallanthus sonchifolius]|uniref:Uncharacterized protein n=1 Tax=Smallanthus sonchifolius TaxID=185202 RepID=A0ACB9IL15_9ASTR|nr:hypothetical protein L1987_24166 [Smallanthus sonchifolius]
MPLHANSTYAHQPNSAASNRNPARPEKPWAQPITTALSPNTTWRRRCPFSSVTSTPADAFGACTTPTLIPSWERPAPTTGPCKFGTRIMTAGNAWGNWSLELRFVVWSLVPSVAHVRNMVGPIAIFDEHQRTVSYEKFVDDRTVVTSSTDGCLKMWDTEDQRLIRTYRGHTNERRFVGLSIWRNQGLIGCGSESNEVFVYDKRWGEPVWVHGFEREGGTTSERGFVSSLCWSQVGDDECTLVAGGSDGVVKIFSGKRKPLINLR